MDIDKIIVLIPQLLLLFIPGFVALIIKTRYLPQKKPDTFETSMYSILYSFIVRILFELLRWIKNRFLSGVILLGNEYCKQFVFLFLGAVLGYALVKAHTSSFGIAVSRFFNKYLDPDAGVWEKAMRNRKGAWATVYLRNGMIYVGALTDFTDDPNEDKKDLILQNYSLYVRKEGKISQPEQFSIFVEDGKPGDKVYLQREDIVAVQIRESASQPQEDQSGETQNDTEKHQ